MRHVFHVSMVTLVVGCTTFSSGSDKPAGPGIGGDPPAAAPAAVGATDGGATDGASAALPDGATPEGGGASTLACNGSTCDPNIGCCVAPGGESCTSTCGGGTLFRCLGREQCGSQVCCLSGKTATCATTCSGNSTSIVCRTLADCPADATACTPQKCGSGYDYSFCTGGSHNAPDITTC